MAAASNARLVAARRLTRRAARGEAGRFLAEGAQAVRAAIAADAVVELFATPSAAERHPELCAAALQITERDAATLSETVTPQGLVAVCRRVDVALTVAVGASTRLVAVVVEPNDPGNLGTIVRTADAAGADAVVVVGGVDVYNGKCVRASAGSLFHLPIAIVAAHEPIVDVLREEGVAVLATTGRGDRDLDELVDDGTLNQATAWLFGSEAHGLPEALCATADQTVRIPIHGRAESLNLAVAAALCLYASARAQRSA